MNNWKLRTWSEVLTIVNGKNQKEVQDKNGKYPIYGSGGLMAYANDYLCDENTTIIGRKGTINSPIYVRTKFWNVDTAFGVSPGDELNPKYLYYFCLAYDFTKHNKSTTLPSLAKRDLLKIEMPVPSSLEIQQKIVFKLDNIFEKMDTAINLLEENIEYVQALMGSVIDEAFKEGEDEGWPILKFIDFAYLRHGHQFRKYDFVKEGIPVVKIGQCQKDGSLDLTNCNYIDSSRLEEFEDDRIYEGDLLMALTGGTLGKVTWVDKDYGDLVQNYRVGNFFPIKGKSIKRFLMYILMSSYFQNLVASKVNQGAQPNIGKENIDNLMVPLPSIETQERLIKKFDIVLNSQMKILQALKLKIKNIEALKKSILDKAFKGEL